MSESPCHPPELCTYHGDQAKRQRLSTHKSAGRSTGRGYLIGFGVGCFDRRNGLSHEAVKLTPTTGDEHNTNARSPHTSQSAHTHTTHTHTLDHCTEREKHGSGPTDTRHAPERRPARRRRFGTKTTCTKPRRITNLIGAQMARNHPSTYR